MNLQAVRWAAIVLTLAPAAAPVAGAQSLPAAAGATSVDAPGTPIPPAVMSRDAAGRVVVRAVRVEAPPVVDGVLDDDVYSSVPAISEFVQLEPRAGEPATEKTEVWILFDRDHLYIAARCHDREAHRIVANDMRRDGRNIGQNDNLSVVLDTFHDRRNGYEFLVNPVGGMWEGQFTDERDFNRDWNTVWTSKSRWTEQGWTVETAIPFRSLRYKGSGPQTWGINVRRTIKWKNEYAYLSMVPRVSGPAGVLRVSSAATLTGLDLPSAALNLDVKPYAVGSLKADRVIDPSLGHDGSGDGGVDVKYAVTRGLTADLTWRTDFAQVEDDDQQVNLTRFTPFFPEKREFFLEGQGIFAFGGVESAPRGTPGNTTANTPWLFFSRQIGLAGGRPVPIDGGARLSGKAGRYSLGLLNIQTGDSPAVGALGTNFSVLRVKREILRRSYVGVIGTRRSPPVRGEEANLAFGVDTGMSFFQNLNLIGFYAQTRTPGADGRQFSYRARLDYNADLLGIQVEQLAVGKDFNPEVGFLRRQGFIETYGLLRVSRRPVGSTRIRKLSLEGTFDYITNDDRRLEDRQAKLTARAELQSGDSTALEYERNFEYLPVPFPITRDISVPVAAYHFSTVRGTYTLGTQRRLAGDLVVARGGFYGGDRTDVSYRGRVIATSRLAIEPGIAINWIDIPQGSFTAKLVSTRTTFAFTPQIGLGALVQYNSTTATASANLRFRWEYSPGSDLFVVYSDGRDTLLTQGPRLVSRTFTVKLTRLLRF
jgi:hypothetical protein